MAARSYTAKDILVLEGLEPVRRRPGMYIGGVDATGPASPALGDRRQLRRRGHERPRRPHRRRRCTRTARRRRSADNGRGIPVDRHAQYKKPALELILTTLHAGGKFEAKNYYHSGGLHGVGASVVTALSREAGGDACKRDGAEWEQTFARGKPTGALKKLGAARGSGTTIFFRPDAQDLPEHPLRRRS